MAAARSCQLEATLALLRAKPVLYDTELFGAGGSLKYSILNFCDITT